MAPITIDISDDDTPPLASAKAGGKRKLDVEILEKITWTDDSDDGQDKSKKQKTKRGASSKGKGKGKAKGKGNVKGKGKRTTPADELDDRIKDLGESEQQDEFSEAELPDYLCQRRRKFDKARETLKEAGLMLPPDYDGIYFSDDERRAKPDERPKFDAKSGIKPCRPRREIQLEYSAGFIPASIAQYLRDYQVAGVKFLHQKFVYQRGGILGDDMGLGKTVQVAAFLTAAFGKTGDERDAKRMRKMRRAGAQWYPRVLIVCPGSLIQNWKNELSRWGWWHVDFFHGTGKEDVLSAAKAGRIEIMITTYATYKMQRDSVNSIAWDCVVADECHCMKDRRSETTKAMNEVNALCRIGLTGTAIQNKYEELWTLLNWTNPGHFGSHQEWERSISKPLTVGQSHDATLNQLSLARMTAKKLVQNLLPEFFLRRMKTLIADQLPKKSDKVVFCPLTDIQGEAYHNFIASPAVELILSVSELCECGSQKKAGWCCRTHLEGENEEDRKHWRSLVFPCIMTLQKIANHVTLLIPNTTDSSEKQQSELRALQVCMPKTWNDLYRNRESMLNLANPEFCGKWKVLRKLLRFWHDNGDKVLVFSHSVRLLRILQHLFHNTSYNVSYLDGSLGYEERQQAVDDFNSDPNQFVFLISTKAGGIGLNITSANKVVIFDPHWNPAYDLQAQDRAYRIGQVRDVDVFRLVSAGTIEEIVYARQVYKQQQANIGYNASSERRYFKGVQKDKDRKGEIFGLANLFSFRKDHILRDIVNKTNVAEAKAGVQLADLDIEKAAKEEENEGELNMVKQEDDDGETEDGGMSQLAKLLMAEHPENPEQAAKAKKGKPKSDAISAILSSVGVEYTHENSEVIGSSKVEAQLSRRAEMAAQTVGEENPEGDSTLFVDSQASSVPAATGGSRRYHFRYNPPTEVSRRQFCTMAREFGFRNATDFALVVESWTQEQRRNCLDTFYKNREAKLLEEDLARMNEENLKQEVKDEKVKPDVEMTDIKKSESQEGDLMTTFGDIRDIPEVQYVKEEEAGSEAGEKLSIRPPRPVDGQDAALAAHMQNDEEQRKAADTEVKAEWNEDKKATTTIFLSDTEDDGDDEL
ncbi:hypothetical protein GQ53DRAFT_745654 [Thozetella sp. PMI_491]|nr:hypothetical protein GQ53DRAFT_745654 [Thozetella sp. PMI_491]